MKIPGKGRGAVFSVGAAYMPPFWELISSMTRQLNAIGLGAK
jgi:hypothetical protein